MFERITEANIDRIRPNSIIVNYPSEGDIRAEMDESDEDNISFYRVEHISRDRKRFSVTPLSWANTTEAPTIMHAKGFLDRINMVGNRRWWLRF